MADKCVVCEKTVYLLDKTSVESKVFHKTCFKCKECNKTLSVTAFCSVNSQYYCKTCYTKNYRSKGNFTTGFGVDPVIPPSQRQ